MRLAQTFFNGPTFPPELRRHARRGRASYHLRAALVYYRAAHVSRARRQFVRALRLAPPAFSRLHLLLFAKSLVPEKVVRRRRSRARRAPQ